MEKLPKNQVVLKIEEIEEPSYAKRESESTSISTQQNKDYTNVTNNVQVTSFTSSPSPDSKYSNKPPKVPPESITRRRSLLRSEFSKPKSRLVEQSYQSEVKFVEEKNHFTSSNLSNRSSPNKVATTPKGNHSPVPVTPRTPRTPMIRAMEDGEDDEDDEDEEVYKIADIEVRKRKSKKLKVMVLIEWFVFVCIMGLLIVSLSVDKLKNVVIWSLELWKWCVLVMVIVCGRMVTRWFMNALVFMVEMNFFWLKKKVLYFIYGVKKSVRVFIWLSLVLLAWGLLFNRGVTRSKKTNKILNYITRALASCLIGAAIWLVKTLLIKLLASSFQCTRFFDRIQESFFHQYILRTLSGQPLMEMAEMVGKVASTGQLSFRTMNGNKEGKKEEVIDVDKLKKMKQDKVSALTMKSLVNVIRTSGLSTISNTLESVDEEEQEDKEITSEWEAKAAAYRIFKNVAKPGNKYIEEEDLLRFMNKDEVDNLLPLFEGASGTGKIKRKSLKNWLVKVYLERKSLVHSLNDTKTAVDELNNIASVVVLIVILIAWLLMMGFLTTQVLVFISSQLLLAGFMFGNTAKTVFEAIVFVFVMHPFDVGDRCVIDGVQMVVEEMNILTTVFLRFDNEKIFYPNSVLSTKPISNFYRSPEMSDSVEFAVDFSTTIETIGALKARIKGYLESKPQHWRAGHNVIVKDIENVDKMKMALYVTHTINFQNYGEKNSRRSELVLELKKIFEDLKIKYNLLPQQVHLNHIGGGAS
ncbi:hypothetical protein Lal_00021888 [Lupinus albus]|uniref:Mechanosensitive ion channel protein n=1 Tax=Lupinus albus TaxID=3870 RepID=A0A6A5M0D4_LUPAL|nr:putative mechanosensitive ion channel MscS, LSM domain-containing protein [Lupinus albus]KAF1864465.1 hypothetical protein Lal_00021888 [Lupinus albus]